MGQLQAQIRSQICATLDDPNSQCAVPSTSNRTSQTYLVNELIREYLEFQGYRATASVFRPEANLTSDRLPRDFLSSKLGLQTGPRSDKLPLLYALAAVSVQDQAVAQQAPGHLHSPE
jgi:lisH domain-containing protein FOPNL